MTKRNIIIELKHTADLASAAVAASPEATLDTALVPKIAGLTIDKSFAPASLPSTTPTSAMDAPYVSGWKLDVSLDPKDATYIVRGEADESKIEEIAAHKSVVGVYADVAIEEAIICPGSPPMGTHLDVERLLCVPALGRAGMNGTGVLVAIVDTGINQAHLAARGRPITVDVARSWVPAAGMTPGAAPVSHGTMCAFDAAIAAPRATFLDIQLLRSSAVGFTGLLSDAVRAYRHLINVMTAPRRIGEARSLVVNNSWGMFHPSWDLPVGHPGNYSDNPNHPFNRIVGALEREGADILFAAGNCGANCPDGRCQNVTANAIYGANGHPSVLTIGGVDISNTRVGYSSQGPGRLSRNKPDLCGYTHFAGSGVYAADGGTSAATPVVAGVVAALRTKLPFIPGNPAATPAAIRARLRTTARDLGTAGFDFDHGFGVVGACALVPRTPLPSICQRFPKLCSERPWDFCRRFPHLCRPPFPQPGAPRPGFDLTGGDEWEPAVPADFDEAGDGLEMVSEAWYAGYDTGTQASVAKKPKTGGCGCGCDGEKRGAARTSQE